MYNAIAKPMETREKRFLSVKFFYKFTDDEFASKIGVGRGMISKIKSGESKFTGETRKGFIEGFPQIDMNWIDTGEGTMFLKKTEPPLLTVQDDNIPYNKKDTPVHNQNSNDPTISISATKAFVKYYERMEILKKLMESNQEEFIEIYEYLNKIK